MEHQDLTDRRRDRNPRTGSTNSALPAATAPPPPPPAFPLFQPASHYNPAYPQQVNSYQYGPPPGNPWHFYSSNVPWYGFQPLAPVPNYSASHYPHGVPVSHGQLSAHVPGKDLKVEQDAHAVANTSGRGEQRGKKKKKKNRKGANSDFALGQCLQKEKQKIIAKVADQNLTHPTIPPSHGRDEKAVSVPKQAATTKKDIQYPHKHVMPAPKPTLAYELEASEEPFVIDSPDRMLVILDLNGTLVYRPDARRHSTKLIARPFLKQFLRFLFDNFEVMIWSSARPQNVQAMVDNALPGDLRQRLAAVWGRDTFKLSPTHYNQKVQVYKNLNIVWANHDIQKRIPGYMFGKRFGQGNTILIDDSFVKAAAQPHNLLEVPSFEAKAHQMKTDVLKQVAGYLEVARMQNNVSSFMRQTPFTADGSWPWEWAPETDLKVQVQVEAEAEADAVHKLKALTIAEAAVPSTGAEAAL